MRTIITAAVVAAGLTAGGQVLASGKGKEGKGKDNYEVTITNITKGLQFTPILVATHRKSVAYFNLGDPASPELALLAEDGATGPLEEALADTGAVRDTANSADVLPPGPPLLFPGQSVTLRISAGRGFDRLSLAAMLLPTNDSFVALNSVNLPRKGSSTYIAVGYDAGSELNDEICENIPGPVCNGVGASPDEDGEGFVHVSSGIAGIGDLASDAYDWRNPVARVVITRVK